MVSVTFSGVDGTVDRRRAGDENLYAKTISSTTAARPMLHECMGMSEPDFKLRLVCKQIASYYLLGAVKGLLYMFAIDGRWPVQG